MALANTQEKELQQKSNPTLIILKEKNQFCKRRWLLRSQSLRECILLTLVSYEGGIYDEYLCMIYHLPIVYWQLAMELKIAKITGFSKTVGESPGEKMVTSGCPEIRTTNVEFST
ncbi:hypothetical protein LAZ67_3003149 [Cordylochernes scorpioides]|uniref:Uncharacterized protein n=1 Tax=Cordylochernes scorpioides TaxID=51811 RepID=A0ABY6K8X6_9ARAC|nr:hypothetical protein LAZ67_3003149 [Cordylochernes scorpioides]